MQDLKLPGADTRLVLFRSTVFKLKYKMSQEVGGSEKNNLKSEIFQEDVKRATAAILSQTLEYGTPPHVKTDNITVHTATHPWTICHKLHFSHHHLTLTPHPRTILMLVTLMPSDHALRNPRPHPHLGKHTRDECPSDEGPALLLPSHLVCSTVSRKRVRVSPENCVHVPVATDAALPVSWKELQRGAPSREAVLRVAEERRRRLQLLSKPCCEGGEEEEEEEEQSGRGSIFSYFKRMLGWM